jgi:primosomal protein N' (replication factor Y) (superfamily II helicase)
VQVRFHGRSVRGWVIGPSDEIPKKILPVSKVVSPVRFFDEELLRLSRWIGERYVAPLAAVLGRLAPPRVASEEAERGQDGSSDAPPRAGGRPDEPRVLSADGAYRDAEPLVLAVTAGSGTFVLRPAPEDEAKAAVELVEACVDSGRRAIVVVPEAAPVPAVAQALIDRFGPRTAAYLGGSKRSRYRLWLDMQAGSFDVVVGTRPAVFAPLRDLGLILVSRESHPAHREDRSPYYHVRDVALTRAEQARAVCVLESICPSSEAAQMGLMQVAPRSRRWPPVEVVKPGPEGRAPRLVRALRDSRRAFLFSPLPGYGIAAVCRECGAPAACARCGGALRSEAGMVRCVVCEAEGRCANCGSASFGLQRGGAERVEEWAAAVAGAQVRRLGPDDQPRLPRDGEVLVGGPDDVRDLGPGGLDLVAVLDADLAERRPGLSARERALTTWMEAIGWARPDGRAIVQSSRPNDPAIQSLVAGKPNRFLVDEAERRRQAGFPVGSAVFRVVGAPGLEDELQELDPITILTSSLEEQAVCLLALEPGRVERFGRKVRDLAARGLVSRVEAEPHL